MRQARRASAVLDRFQHPSQVIAAGFGAALLVGTGLLALPFATASGEATGWLTALFTATSAVCVTGLTVVDTASHWSLFGEIVIAALIQVGGLGIMTLATLFTVLVSGRLGLRARLFAQAETKALSVADVRRVVRDVVLFSLACETFVAVVLTLRFALGYGEPFGRALYLGIFHAVSAFNNAGFALWPDNLMRFVTDPWVCLTIAAVVWAELRGETRVNVGHRRLPESVQRQAVALVVIGVSLIAVSTYVLLVLTPHGLDRVLFEVVSAFGAADLSTGITADVTPAGHLLLVLLMFAGRIGPLTLGSALALKERTRRYELPEERIIVG